MKPIAIHDSPLGFHPRWIAYCRRENIPYKCVNCYSNDLIEELKGCCALMWHHSQSKPEDVLVAKSILDSLHHVRFPIFPDYHGGWHFDDKIAQKYLLELLQVPMVPTFIFFDRNEAMSWVGRAKFPKVFKLRRGAGSASVQIVESKRQAKSLVRQAFGRGFQLYNPWGRLKEQFRRAFGSQADPSSLLKAAVRLVYPPAYARVLGRERGYVYFQEFLPGNDYDFRMIVVGRRAFGLKRLVRKGDFRASGSGQFEYLHDGLDRRVLELAFGLARKLGSSCLSMDIVFTESMEPRVLEFSFGFIIDPYDHAPGYWDEGFNWHEGSPDPMSWIVESVLERVNYRQQSEMCNTG